MSKNKVILVADIYESFPELSNNDKQEWENQKSIDFLLETISEIGYEPVLVEPKKSKVEFINKIKSLVSDDLHTNPILFNLVEGFSSRNREAYVPALGEFLGIPFTGSDAYSQNISLDKHLTKLIASQNGIPTKKSYCINNLTEIPDTIHYPLFVKPNGEGSSLGIGEANVIQTQKELLSKVGKLLFEFDSVLLEEYLKGKDLTLGVFGNFPNYEASSVAIVSYPANIYSEEIKSKESMSETLSFGLDQRLERKIQLDSVKICKILKTSGFARLDWKCDSKGNPFFLEINLTAGLSRYYSSLPICYEASFGIYSDLIKKILQFGYQNYNTCRFFNYGRMEKF